MFTTRPSGHRFQADLQTLRSRILSDADNFHQTADLFPVKQPAKLGHYGWQGSLDHTVVSHVLLLHMKPYFHVWASTLQSSRSAWGVSADSILQAKMMFKAEYSVSGMQQLAKRLNSCRKLIHCNSYRGMIPFAATTYRAVHQSY